MSREITTHKVNGCNDELTVLAVDEPGSGNACHVYSICVPNGDPGDVRLCFQNGPIKDVGTNGITQEALLAVCIDRLRGFQSGKFACRENAIALTHLEDAVHWLQHRTNERLKRGVEGTHTV